MKCIVTILALTCVSGLASAQEQGWGAKFFKDGLTHDFGNVPYGAKLTYKFPIKNIYNQTFTISESTPSCTCTSTKKPALQIPPLGTSELEVSMDTLRINPPGPKTVYITVTFTSVPAAQGDKVFSSKAVLSVSCVPKTNLVFRPGEINFGVVNQGQTPKQVLEIEHAGDPNWRITGKVANNFPVDVNVYQVQAQQPGMVNYQVQATLKPNAPAGEFKHEIQLQTSDQQTLNIVVSAVVQAPLVATPNEANFGTANVGAVSLKYVVVRASKPFKITKVDGAGGDINVKYPDKSATAHVLTIEYLPKQPGKLNTKLTINTDLDGNLSTSVAVDGAAVP